MAPHNSAARTRRRGPRGRLLQPGMSSETTNSTPCRPRAFNISKKVLAPRSALPVGQLDREDLAPAFPVDADRDQHRLAGNDPVVPDALLAGVQDQVGEWLPQLAFAERLQ